MKPGLAPRSCSAFSRIDLLVVTVTLAIFAVTLLPALARVHVQPQGTQCLDNLRQITMGWWMYANDNEGRLAANRGLLPANEDYAAYPRWVSGDMQGGIVSPIAGGPTYTGIDATNSALLVDSRYTQLARYVTNPTLYRCPADLSTWTTVNSPGHDEMPRVRSYSMNGAIGPSENGTLVGGDGVMGHWLSSENSRAPGGFPWRVPIKAADLTAPVPSQLFLLLDEHPESINDGCFAVEMPTAPNFTELIDVPATYHNNSCNFSFADGHVENHTWLKPGDIEPVSWMPDTMPPIGGVAKTYPADPDVIWLAHHTAAPAPNSGLLYLP